MLFFSWLDSLAESCGILYQVIARSKPLLENEVIEIEAIVEENDRSQTPVMLANLSNKTVNVTEIAQLGTVLNNKTKRQVKIFETRSYHNIETINNPDEISVHKNIEEK